MARENGSSPAFLAGGGEMGGLIRSHDWASTALGAPENWPQPLRTAVRLILNTGHPMYIWWGPDLICFYNDAYRQSIGPERHPGSLGQPGRSVWEEIWPLIGAEIEQVMSGGGATWHENQLVPITRNGRLEDVYWTYSYGPIDDDTAPNGVGGVLVVCTETTEQVNARQLLTIERERQRLMLQHMPGFVAFLAGPQHRYEYVNDAYRVIAGDRDFIGRTVREVFPDIAGQGFYELLDEVYTSGCAYAAKATPLNLDRPDGDRFIDFLYAPVQDDAGEVAGIFVGGYDATEQVRATDRLRQSEADLRITLKAGRFGAWSLDLADNTLTSSEICRENFGRDPDQPFTYAELLAAVHPEDQARMVSAVEECLSTRGDYDIEYRIFTPSGQTRWVHVRGQATYDADGVPRRMAGVSIDITERRQAETELRETAERLRLATENAEVGFWDVDPINDVLIWAPRTKAMFGISPDAPVTMQDFYDGLHPDDRAATGAAYAAAADPDRRALYDVEYRTIGKEDGLIRWVAAKGRGVFDEADRCVRVAGTAIDITSRKRAEELLRELNETLEARVIERTAELEAAHDQLRQSQKLEAMGSLTGGVAHDFNNLLMPIVGTFEMLQRMGVGGEREQRAIAGAIQSADRAKTLVQRLLAFARRQPLQPVAVDLGQLVRNMAGLVASTTGPQIKVVVDVADGLPAAKADPNQLEMALLNLSVNARDAMPDGGVLRISATQETVGAKGQAGLKPGSYLCLSVADTGVGMDEATLARAVEPFFSTKGIGKGTGLGLSMVHGLASQLGGELRIKSRPGLGTNVELWLAQTQDTPEAPAATREADIGRGRGVALLVDDEESVRHTAGDMLVDLGYEVFEARSAEEALQMMRNGVRVDLVITDHLMPGMSGVDLARAVHEHHPNLPVLIVSGYADVDGIAADLPRLTKPFLRADLASAIAGLARDA